MAVERVTRVIGASPISFQAALDEGLQRASKTLRGIRTIEVIRQKARVDRNQIQEYLAEMDITFVLEE